MEEYKVETIKEGIEELSDQLPWTKLHIKLGNEARSVYVEKKNFLDVLLDEAAENEIDIDTDIEDNYQQMFKEVANAYWLSRMMKEIRPDLQEENEDMEQVYTAALEVVSEEGYNPLYSKEEFYSKHLKDIKKDIYKGDISEKHEIENVFTDNYQFGLEIKSYIEEKLQEI